MCPPPPPPQHTGYAGLPGCVVDEGLALVLGELVGLELLNGRDSRPGVLVGSACERRYSV